MADLARLVGMSAGAWLVAIGLLMAIAPRRCLTALAAAGGSALVHFGELVPRTIVGIALVLAASGSRFPAAIAVIGWILIVSAVVLMALPRRWHASYSRWWAERIPATAVRLMGPLSIVAGCALAWCMV